MNVNVTVNNPAAATGSGAGGEASRTAALASKTEVTDPDGSEKDEGVAGLVEMEGSRSQVVANKQKLKSIGQVSSRHY